MSLLDLRYARQQKIKQLDPVTDHCLICHLLAGYEFPWDITLQRTQTANTQAILSAGT